MYFYNICTNPDILRVIHLILKILDFVFLVIPIGLIVFITIDLIKSIIGDDKSVKENNKRIITRIIFALVMFFVPTIVTVIMNTLSVAGIETEYKMCLDNAKYIGIINSYQRIYDANKEKEKLNYNTVTITGNQCTDLSNKMISIASKEIGNTDSSKYINDLNYGTQGVAWCAIFATWVSKNTIIYNTNLYDDIITKNSPLSGYASVTRNIEHFNNQNNLKFYFSNTYGGNYTPKKGDYIFFDWDKNWNKSFVHDELKNYSDHVGIVKEVKNGTVYTIEGNSGKPGKVNEKSYTLTSGNIMGYGVWCE